MRKTIKILGTLLVCFAISCSESTDPEDYEFDYDNQSSSDCGYHNGNQLYLGPQGGCYYINSNGNKTYVDRSECDC